MAIADSRNHEDETDKSTQTEPKDTKPPELKTKLHNASEMSCELESRYKHADSVSLREEGIDAVKCIDDTSNFPRSPEQQSDQMSNVQTCSHSCPWSTKWLSLVR